MQKTYVIDIETRPHPELKNDADYWATRSDDLSAPAHYKDPAKIEAWRTEKTLQLRREMALRAHLGIVACIGFADMDAPDPPVVLAIDDESLAGEADLLTRFHTRMEGRPTFVGWNIRDFDIPFLLGRYSIVDDHWAPGFLPLPRHWHRVVDLYEILGGRLDDWQFALGLGRKDPLIEDMPLPMLAARCSKDVSVTRHLAHRLEWAWRPAT